MGALLLNFGEHGAFNKDEFSRLCQPVQGRLFLLRGKEPAVGQRTETQVTLGSAFCRLSGVVTGVDPPPSAAEMQGSLLLNHGMSPEQCIAIDGALHGQMLTVRATLNFDFYKEPFLTVIGQHRVYELRYKCDDNFENIWQVDSAIALDLQGDAAMAYVLGGNGGLHGLASPLPNAPAPGPAQQCVSPLIAMP